MEQGHDDSLYFEFVPRECLEKMHMKLNVFVPRRSALSWLFFMVYLFYWL